MGELDLLLYVVGPVLALVALVFVAAKEWSNVRDDHFTPDEPHGFR